MNKEDLQQFKQKLLEEKNGIEEELMGIAEKDPNVKGKWDTKFPQFGDVTADQDENADEVEEYMDELPIEHNLEERLADIELAIAKIEENKNYGRCEECGKEIQMGRLSANPEARLCMEHAK